MSLTLTLIVVAVGLMGVAVGVLPPPPPSKGDAARASTGLLFWLLVWLRFGLFDAL